MTVYLVYSFDERVDMGSDMRQLNAQGHTTIHLGKTYLGAPVYVVQYIPNPGIGPAHRLPTRIYRWNRVVTEAEALELRGLPDSRVPPPTLWERLEEDSV